MKFLVFFLPFLIQISVANPLLNLINRGLSSFSKLTELAVNRHTTFTSRYHKKYGSTNQLTFRAVVFNNNLDLIQRHNKNLSNSYLMGVTRFFDMTNEEFRTKVLMSSFSKIVQNTTITNKITTIKASVNWRSKNMTGVIENQGECGSCYAFTVLASIQSMYLIRNMSTMGVTGKLLSFYTGTTLSEQHIIDCCNVAGRCDMGCGGGYMWDVYNFISTYGVSLEQTYPYRADSGNYQKKCLGINGQFKKVLNNKNPYTNISRGNVEALRQAVLKGPVSVLIDATNLPFYIANETTKNIPFSDCGNTHNHAVLLVGVDEKGNWIIKNSWGEQWGDGGYIILAAGNTCGIADYAVYPNPYVQG